MSEEIMNNVTEQIEPSIETATPKSKRDILKERFKDVKINSGIPKTPAFDFKPPAFQKPQSEPVAKWKVEYTESRKVPDRQTKGLKAVSHPAVRYFNDDAAKNRFTAQLNKQNIVYNVTQSDIDENAGKKRRQISELKRNLAAMDYKGQKYLDGEYTISEWEDIVIERKAIRAQIRQLENQV